MLDQHGASVDIVAISEVSLSFTMETKRLPKALLSELERIADVTCEDQQAIVCLVGEDIHGRPGIAASVFTTVAEAGVNVRMISQGASEINISFVIKESDVPRAVRHLHNRFFPSHCGTVGPAFTVARKPSAGKANDAAHARNGNGSNPRSQVAPRIGKMRSSPIAVTSRAKRG